MDPVYLTPTFGNAARMPAENRHAFLSELRSSPFYRPEVRDNLFRDTAVFCLGESGHDAAEFSRRLSIPASLLGEWVNGRHLPYAHRRRAYAEQMIAAALEPGHAPAP